VDECVHGGCVCAHDLALEILGPFAVSGARYVQNLGVLVHRAPVDAVRADERRHGLLDELAPGAREFEVEVLADEFVAVLPFEDRLARRFACRRRRREDERRAHEQHDQRADADGLLGEEVRLVDEPDAASFTTRGLHIRFLQ